MTDVLAWRTGAGWDEDLVPVALDDDWDDDDWDDDEDWDDDWDEDEDWDDDDEDWDDDEDDLEALLPRTPVDHLDEG